MIELKPLKRIVGHYNSWPTVFLAGSIEMDKAEPWQAKVVNDLKSIDVVVLNPRREDWDSSWKQEMSDPQFMGQVTWELDGIDQADIVAFYFDPKTKSPVTLLELGLCIGKNQRIIVCCPDGFWRKGNIEIVCKRNNVLLVETYSELITILKQAIDANILSSTD